MMPKTNVNEGFTGKVAFVTGGASGIGRAAALAFARAGASVAVADVSEERNQETASMVERLGARALAVRCDLTRTADVKAALKKTVEAFGQLDVAFNNAGVEPRKLAPMADVDEEEWDRILAIDLRGVFLCMKYEIPLMLERRRRHREHILGSRSHRHQGKPCVLRREARRDRPHPSGGPRLRRAEHPRQRRLPGVHRYADDGALHWRECPGAGDGH